MRKLLLLALLLCKCLALIKIRIDLGARSDHDGLTYLTDDIIALLVGTRQGGYDYDESDKRHSLDDRRSWRKKALQPEDKDWNERRRHEYDGQIYEEMDGKSFGERRDPDASYRRRYEDVDKLNVALGAKSNEQGHTYL